MHRIGMQLITERRDEVLTAASKPSLPTSPSNTNIEKVGDGDEDLDERTRGRDLLSVLSTFITCFLSILLISS